MIWITQWLCPKSHCSIAFIWDPAENTSAEIAERGEALFREGFIARICGICRSTDLRPEHSQTRFRTMEEGLPEFRRLQRENEIARALLGDPTPPRLEEVPYLNLLEDL